MAAVVADCSAFLALCFEDDSSVVADRLIDGIAARGALVPAIWWYEIRNVLVVNERRGRIEAEQSDEFLRLLGRLPITVVLDEDQASVVDLARRSRLTVYDAAYLALSKASGLPLVTLDRALGGGARDIGIEVVGG